MTIIIITHRNEIISDADYIVQMQDGTVVNNVKPD